MGPNIFFVSLGGYSAFRFFKTAHPAWPLLAGLSVGAAANGHFYINILLLPYLLALFVGARGWKTKILASTSYGAGHAIALIPILIASAQEGGDLLSGYSYSGGADLATSMHARLIDAVGFAATLFGTAGGYLGPALAIALIWLAIYAWRQRHSVATLLVLCFGTVLLLLPHAVGAENPGRLDEGLCGTISRALSAPSCHPTQTRYMDVLYPLPLVAIAWCAASLTKKRFAGYAIACIALVVPLVPPALAEIDAERPERLEHVASAIRSLPRSSCVVVHSAYRDYSRIWTVAGSRRVFTLEEFRLTRPSCEHVYLVSAYSQRYGHHLEHIETIQVQDTPLWYLYRVRDRTETDLVCPTAAASSRLDQAESWQPDPEVPNRLVCTDTCSGEWRLSISEPYRHTPLHLVADCTTITDKGWLWLSNNNGATWHPTCNTTPFEEPKTRWVDTGIEIAAGSQTQVTILVKTDPENNSPQVFTELRACPNIPVDSEALIWSSPLKWI